MRASKTDIFRFSKAVAAATTSELPWKVGAVLVSGGRTLAVSSNLDKHWDERVLSTQPVTIHAEQAVIESVQDASGATLYVARIHSDGELAPSLPCWRCAQRVRDAGISRIVYFDGNTVSAVRSRTLEVRAERLEKPKMPGQMFAAYA